MPPPADAASRNRTSPGSDRPGRTDTTVDLRQHEAQGGHTLARHVGRTDAQLRARLDRESISAASTYVDLANAERVVALALADNERRVQRWVDQRGPRSNLAIRYRARDGLPTGRMLRRGSDAPEDVTGAVVVLRWRDDAYYVLTSYPEASR
ncbi:MAG TPA: RNase A-like domain-containing protein [Luteitalea sp.]|nr:RNase A-like domain-containing protein [Luteitalea sp.]